MENEKNDNLCAQVRSIYGDSKTEFAARMGVSAESILRWERQGLPDVSAVHALFVAAHRGTFPSVPPRFSKKVEAMTDAEVVAHLIDGFGDNKTRFAERIGVNYATVTNWSNAKFKNSPAGRRLLRHIMEHPEEFSYKKKEYKRKAFKRENVL